jgi:hypothetical protein
MKKPIKIIIFIFLTILLGCCGIFMAFQHRFIPSPKKSPASGMAFGWKVFRAENPPFNFVFEYPESWKIKTSRFSGKFDMVSVLGVQDKKTKFVVAAFIVKKPASSGKAGGQLAEEVLDNKKQLPEFQILQKGYQKTNLGEVFTVEYKYAAWLPPDSPAKQKAAVFNKESFLIRNSFAYRFSFVGIQDQYKAFLPFFEHIVKTFEIED